MKPQSLQDAIKAAAAKKRSKVEQGGWKEPEVKTHRLTADEYQAAKSGGRCGGGRPQVPSAAVGSGVATTTSNGSTGSGISAQASSDLLRKIESERREFLKEKQEILSEMRAYRREMTETKQPHCASLRQSVDLLSSKVERLEIENKTLFEKVRNGSNNHQQSSRISTTDLDVERLEARVEKLESENRKLRERIISGGGGDDIERLQSKVERLEDESRRLREKTTAIDQLEEETRRLRDKLSAISSFPTSPLTSRAEASVPVTPKSPAVSKSSYTPISPSTPAKAPVATNALAYKSPSPTKTPKKTKSASSIASPGLDARSGGSALCRLFSADKLSKQQGTSERSAVGHGSCAFKWPRSHSHPHHGTPCLLPRTVADVTAFAT
jgi:outer membrane murein-binding lipoprotein Lpp